jgi:acetyl-CoA acetyltransferase
LHIPRLGARERSGTVTPARRAAITGVGETEYVRGTDKSVLQLLMQASLAACADAGVAPADVDGVVIPLRAATAEDFVMSLGIGDLRFHAANAMGGASPVAGVMIAAAAVQAGLAERLLVAVGGTQFSGPSKLSATDGRSTSIVWPSNRFRTHLEHPYGFAVPMQWYSLHANRWFHETKADPAGMREVALATRAHAHNNAKAHFKDRPLTAEQYDASPMLVRPFRLFDICLETDGAAAVLVQRVGSGSEVHREVVIVDGGEGHADVPDDMISRPDVLNMGLTKVGPRVLQRAGVRPEDFDVAEIYDCFTFVVLRQLEELGFCGRGEGPDFVRETGIGPGGRLPVNTHGGLLSQAHIVGMNHVVEAVKQLRGEAGLAQVQDAHLGLVTNYGDFSDGSLLVLQS